MATSRHSGVRIIASDADLGEAGRQVQDAETFFHLNRDALLHLMSFPGVEAAELDFGVELHPPASVSCSLPPRMMQAAASMNISVVVSVYPVDE